VCSDVALVVSVLRDDATLLDDVRPLPDPGAIWWRAQLERRSRSARRVTRVLDAFQAVAALCGVAAAALLAPWVWPQVKEWLGAAKGSAEAALPSAAGLAQPSVVLVISTCLVLLLVATGYYDSWAED